MAPIRRHYPRAIRVALAACLAAGAVACASHSYTIQRETRQKYPRIRRVEDIECFAAPMPAGRSCKLIATVSSACATTSTLEVRQRQMEQLRKAASLAGAEAVYDVRVETRQTRGVMRDPYTPFPSIAQGWSDSYYMQGKAVLFEDNFPAATRQYEPQPSGRRPPF